MVEVLDMNNPSPTTMKECKCTHHNFEEVYSKGNRMLCICYCQPSEENCPLCQYESRNGHAPDCPNKPSEEKECICGGAFDEPVFKDCPIHPPKTIGVAPKQSGWEEEFDNTFGTNLWKEMEYAEKKGWVTCHKEIKSFLADLLKGEREKTKQLLLERMPEKLNTSFTLSTDKYYPHEKEIYNKAIDDIHKALSEIFEGKEGKYDKSK